MWIRYLLYKSHSTFSVCRIRAELQMFRTAANIHRTYLLFFFCTCTKNGSRCLRDVIIFLWIHIWRACVRFSTESETLRVGRARGRNLYFWNVTRCRCKIWNINASQHSHNRPRTNRAVRSVLFFFFFYFNAFLSSAEWYLRHFHRNPLSPSLATLFPFASFSLVRTPIQNGSRGRNVAIITLLPRPNHS